MFRCSHYGCRRCFVAARWSPAMFRCSTTVAGGVSLQHDGRRRCFLGALTVAGDAPLEHRRSPVLLHWSTAQPGDGTSATPRSMGVVGKTGEPPCRSLEAWTERRRPPWQHHRTTPRVRPVAHSTATSTPAALHRRTPAVASRTGACPSSNGRCWPSTNPLALWRLRRHGGGVLGAGGSTFNSVVWRCVRQRWYWDVVENERG